MTLPINPEQLDANIKQHRKFFIAGDETLLVEEVQDQLRAFTKQQGAVERKLFSVNKSFDFNLIFTESDNLSLFSDTQLIELRFDKAPDRNQQKELVELFANPTEDFLLVSLPKLDAKQWKAKWIKEIEKQALTVQVWPVNLSQFPRWLSNRARASGLEFEPEAMQLLIEKSEGNLLAAKQELDRLSLLFSNQIITKQQVAETAAENARFNIFEIIDTALSGNSQKIPTMLQGIKREGVPAILLLNSIYREARQMAAMSELIANGEHPSSVMSSYRIWSSRQSPVQRGLNKVPPRVWKMLVSRCAHLDKVLKGLEEGNLWDELLTCLLFMSGRQLWKKVI